MARTKAKAGTGAATVPPGEGAALLAAVLAQPDEDGPRLVYGDWLQDRGDVRGELIVLQCSKVALTEEQEQRVRDLLEEHARGWLGPLVEVAQEVEFRRGFAATVGIAEEAQEALAKVAGAPEWATVERLDFHGGAGGVLVRTMADGVRERTTRGARVPAAQLLLDPRLRALREVHGIDGDVLMTLCGAERPLPFEGVHAHLKDRRHRSLEGLAALGRTGGLPRLRRLHLEGNGPAGALFRGPLTERLELVELRNWDGTLGDRIADVATSTRLPELLIRRSSVGDVYPRWSFRLRRGSDGALTDLEARIDLTADLPFGRGDDQLTRALTTIPPHALTSLRVCWVGADLAAAERALIEKTAARFTRLASPPSLRREP